MSINEVKAELISTQNAAMKYINEGYHADVCYLYKLSLLKIYIDPSITTDVRKKYYIDIMARQRKIIEYLNKYFISCGAEFYKKNMQHISKNLYGSEWERFANYTNNEYHSSTYLEDYCNNDVYLDAGFDLYVPNSGEVYKGETMKIDMNVKTAMFYNGVPTSYYMYPRSSTGSKTPMRLANSVGIIDAGYRGNIIAVFDVKNGYNVKSGDRLVQLCSGNLNLPIFPYVVFNEHELGSSSRGIGGFGSTGK